MLDLARTTAAARALRKVDFRMGELTRPEAPGGDSDVVICVIALLVAPELAPGGTQPAHTGTQPAHTVDWRPWRQSGPTSAPPNTRPELVRLFAL